MQVVDATNLTSKRDESLFVPPLLLEGVSTGTTSAAIRARGSTEDHPCSPRGNNEIAEFSHYSCSKPVCYFRCLTNNCKMGLPRCCVCICVCVYNLTSAIKLNSMESGSISMYSRFTTAATSPSKDPAFCTAPAPHPHIMHATPEQNARIRH